MNCCKTTTNSAPRCFTPLVAICDTTGYLSLDLGLCDPCNAPPAALALMQGGCKEYEVVCEDPDPIPACGSCPPRPNPYGNLRVVEKPKLTVVYPLHEVNAKGEAVFVLDDELKKLGYGRLSGVLLYGDPTNWTLGVRFDVDYLSTVSTINSISTEARYAPEVC